MISYVRPVGQYLAQMPYNCKYIVPLSSIVLTNGDFFHQFEDDDEDVSPWSLLQLAYTAYTYITGRIQLEETDELHLAKYGDEKATTCRISLFDLDPSLLKSFSVKCPETATWTLHSDWRLYMEFIETTIENSIRYSLQLMKRITVLPTYFTVVEAGGKYSFKKINQDDFGTLVICLPGKYTGGALTVLHNGKRRTPAAILSACRWLAIFGNSTVESETVTSGTQIIITCSLRIGKDIMPPEISRSIFCGDVDVPRQRDLFSQFCSKMDQCSFGVILQDVSPSLLEDDQTHNLKGSTAILVEVLKRFGFGIQIKRVIFRKATVPEPMEAWKKTSFSKVYLFGPKELEFGCGIPGRRLTPPPLPPQLPFFDTMIPKKNQSRHTRRLLDIVTYQYLGYTEFFITSALIATRPSPWSRMRILWIGLLKNKKEECPLASISPFMIRKILAFLYSGADPLMLHRRIYEEGPATKRRRI